MVALRNYDDMPEQKPCLCENFLLSKVGTVLKIDGVRQLLVDERLDQRESGQ